jgi:hypothetical protein
LVAGNVSTFIGANDILKCPYHIAMNYNARAFFVTSNSHNVIKITSSGGEKLFFIYGN